METTAYGHGILKNCQREHSQKLVGGEEADEKMAGTKKKTR